MPPDQKPTEQHPLSYFTKDTRQSAEPGVVTGPTPGDVRKKLMEVLDTLQDTSSLTAVTRALADSAGGSNNKNTAVRSLEELNQAAKARAKAEEDADG